MLELLRRAYEALPGVAELELVEAAAGLRPGHAGQRADRRARSASPGLWWATGHWRNGILLAPLTAEAIAQALQARSRRRSSRRSGRQRFAARARAEVSG